MTVALTALAGPLYGIADRAAADLLDRTPYVTAVFGGGGRAVSAGDAPAAGATRLRAPAAAAGLAGAGLDPAVGHLVVGQPALAALVVALAVTALLPLPPVVGGIRVRPLALLRFLGDFVVDLVRSGAQVAWQTLRPGRHPAAAPSSRCSCAPTPTCCSRSSPRRCRWSRARW